MISFIVFNVSLDLPSQLDCERDSFIPVYFGFCFCQKQNFDLLDRNKTFTYLLTYSYSHFEFYFDLKNDHLDTFIKNREVYKYFC